MSEISEEQQGRGTRRWYHRVGPGLITACVVIGPGSILTSSNVGAKYGYGMAWVVVVAVVCMMVYMTLGARIGVISGRPAGELVVQGAGRWLAVLIGLGVFFISASFQFGNNLGVHSAFQVYLEDNGPSGEPARRWAGVATVVGFNVLSIVFLFGARNLYRAIERLMMLFVALMLLAFAVNLGFAQPSPVEALSGFVPRLSTMTDISVLGMVGTTFVITGAYFQSYLVRQKGWGRAEMEDGLRDVRIGSLIMMLITLMIMFTAASVLRGAELTDVKDVARSLQPLFGDKGQAIFCLGLFAAAYSSFLVNSMIGGFILADALGLGSRPTDVWPRVITAGVLLTGMGMALYVIQREWHPLPAIVMGQAVTVLAAPLMAGTLLWLSNRRAVMGEDRNGPVLNALAGMGFVLLLAMAWYVATERVWPGVEKLLGWA